MRKRSSARPSTTASATSSGSITPSLLDLLDPDVALRLLAEDHVGPDPLRAEAGDLDAAVAVGDPDPFRQAHRGMLGGRVGGVAERGEKSRRRRCDEEVAAASLDPAGDQVAGGDHGAHQVDPPDLVPLAVGSLDAGAGADPGVRAVEVDLPSRASTSSIKAATAASSPTSQRAPLAEGPMAAATSSARAPSRSASTTARAPSAAKRRPSAEPMPPAPPVTTTTLSFTSMPKP